MVVASRGELSGSYASPRMTPTIVSVALSSSRVSGKAEDKVAVTTKGISSTRMVGATNASTSIVPPSPTLRGGNRHWKGGPSKRITRVSGAL